jgi:1-aminocyclopropane-1-carboxylate deaminase
VLIDSIDNFFARSCTVPLQPVVTKTLVDAGIELLVRRDDLFDPEISGNKFYKLFFNLQAAQQQGCSQLLSFGGAYSNHLHALAAAGHRYGFATIGVVRGERPARLSPTLLDAEAWGMRLIFLSRSEYRDKKDHEVIDDLRRRCGEFYLIAEGGAGLVGAQGMQLMGQALEQQLKGDYTQVCVACGTGTSLAGIASGIHETKSALGFSVLKGQGGLAADIALIYSQLVSNSERKLADVAANWQLISGYHCGGYGKKHPDYLIQFWQSFEQSAKLLLDPIYTVKMFWGIHCLAQQNYWPRGSRLIVVHTGGLQGRRGFNCP